MFDPFLQSNLSHEKAQGANVGEIRSANDGYSYRWDGVNWVKEGGGGSGSSGAGGFNFDWSAAEKAAFEKLKPYYEEKLKQAQGDVDMAKGRIDEDYTSGVRRTDEDFTRGTRINQEDYQAQNQQYSADVKDETRDTRGALNARGVLLGETPRDQSGGPTPESGFAKDWVTDPMRERQSARKLAIDRAMQRQGEVLGVGSQRAKEDLERQKSRGIQDQDSQFDKYKKLLEEEKQNKAVLEMAPLEYQREYQKWKGLNGYF